MNEIERLAARRQSAWLRLSHPHTEQEHVDLVGQVHRITRILNEHAEDFGVRYPKRAEGGLYAGRRRESAKAAGR